MERDKTQRYKETRAQERFLTLLILLPIVCKSLAGPRGFEPLFSGSEGLRTELAVRRLDPG